IFLCKKGLWLLPSLLVLR
nr:immunoglobulin heavy chain junction region [Mus musculus]